MTKRMIRAEWLTYLEARIQFVTGELELGGGPQFVEKLQRDLHFYCKQYVKVWEMPA